MLHFRYILCTLLSYAISVSTGQCTAPPSIDQNASNQTQSDKSLRSNSYKLTLQAEGQPRKKAIALYQQILVASDAALVKFPDSYEAQCWRCIALEGIGDFLANNKKNFDRAITSYELATQSADKCLQLHKTSYSYRLSALPQLGIGRIEWMRRHYPEAKSALSAALKDSETGLERLPYSKSTLYGCKGRALLYLGFCQAENHDDNQAKNFLSKSIDALKAALEETKSDTLSPVCKVMYLDCEARAFRKIGYFQKDDPAAAITSFNSAIQAADTILSISPNSRNAKAMKKDVGAYLRKLHKDSV